ncbi:MAG: argininosuccinate synthase [Clostridiaceae bacterium]|nr:argininosuccinate synthase [Clostridiaceae bacterium]
MAKEKILLAYSGGLDTSVIIPWLLENYDCEIIAVAGDCGIGIEPAALEAKALKSGASKCYVLDITRELIVNYIYPMLKAGAVYEGKYLLGTSIARPAIAAALVKIAKQENCTAICHGATGKGNDQVRFELSIKALAPDMKIIAPWRIWDIRSRDEELEYAIARGIPVPVTKEENYSRDQNIWHLSHEGMDLESPANIPQYEKLLHLSVTPEQAPDEPTYVTIDFEAGIPVSVDGITDPVKMLEHLNAIGGANAIGIRDMVENRLVGMKSRGVYETPGGAILYAAHAELEALCLERDTMHYKEQVALRFAELVYYGQWFHPLREALSAFVDATQQTVSGTVKLKLYKGNIITISRTSPYSLYDEALSTFAEDDVYDQSDATGFINLFGLPIKVYAKTQARNRKNEDNE